MKLYLILLLCLCTTSLCFSKSFDKKNDSTIKANSNAPSLQFEHEGLLKALQPAIQYPKFAKRKFIKGSSNIQLTIDETGKIEGSKVQEGGFLLFDTIAFKVIQQTEGYWTPAKDEKARR